jgi:hypothetical protein|mmetsp:Transcript_4701/g.7657  ORF Transcript_4701/g.7657 Transcript_4701/m.7657 type:complete len:255 (-) Transcript_4701:139-903(-)
MTSRKTNDTVQGEDGGDVFRFQFRKTRLCVFHMEGRCRYGTNCGFAHSSSEMEMAPDLTKTSLCEKWHLGECYAGVACKFAHGIQDLRTTPQFARARQDKKQKAAKQDVGKHGIPKANAHAPKPTLDERFDWKMIESFRALKAKSQTEDMSFGLWEEGIGNSSQIAPPVLAPPSPWVKDNPMKVKFEQSLNDAIQGSNPYPESSIPVPQKLVRKFAQPYEPEAASTTGGSNSDDRSSHSQSPRAFETSYLSLRL